LSICQLKKKETLKEVVVVMDAIQQMNAVTIAARMHVYIGHAPLALPAAVPFAFNFGCQQKGKAENL
jgi:hypothetical protein